MRSGMLEAARLVRGGALHAATAVIQRTLAGVSKRDGVADGRAGTDAAPVADSFRDIDAAGGSPASAEVHRRSLPTLLLPADCQGDVASSSPGPESNLGCDRTRVQERAPRESQFLTGSYSNEYGARPYKLYIPADCDGQPLPLIVMLHGCTQSPDDFAAGTRMNALAEEHSCLVVYPAQTPAANQSKCWNWFMKSHQHRDRGEPSIIAGITRDIMASYAVDPQRVYVAGLSAGGAMAGIMGMTYPDLYAAIGIHSGLAYAVAHDLPSALAAMKRGPAGSADPRPEAVPDAGTVPWRVVPTIVFHGDADTTVHPRNADGVIAHWKRADARGSMSVDGPTDPQARVRRGQVPGGRDYSCATFRAANGHVVLEQWRIHGAGHAWSGGSPSGSYTDPQGPDATREMLRFFHQHRNTTAVSPKCRF
jgi:poly(hydroxyalkanoate) depolymerase family esterase